MDLSTNSVRKEGFDKVILILYLLIVTFGIMNIYSSEHSITEPFNLTMSMRTVKQLIWLGISLFVGIAIVFVVSAKLFETYSPVIYLFTEFLLIAVIFLGVEIKGSHSWFALGPVRFQPAELAKIATSLYLAAIMSYPTFSLHKWKDFITAAIIVLLPMATILLENETGSSLVFASLVFVFYREGLSGWLLVALGAFILFFILSLILPLWVAVVILASLLLVLLAFTIKKVTKRRRLRFMTTLGAIFLAGTAYIYSVNYIFNNILLDHQRKRIAVLLGIMEDPLGIGYNVTQSMIAIGSGGFIGKGYLNGTQNILGFVPEQSTDFIFCTVGEEWGFIGCLFLLGLYIALILRIILVSERAKTAFCRIYGYCLACIIFFHVIVNIGMTIGLMPVIGIPLPFFSYGGSSLLGFTTMLMIFLAILRSEKR